MTGQISPCTASRFNSGRQGESHLPQGLFAAGQVHLQFQQRVSRLGADGDETALGRRLGIRQVLDHLDRGAVVANRDPLGEIAVHRDPLHPALVVHGQYAGLAQIVGRLQEIVRHRGDRKRQQFIPRGTHDGFAAKHVRRQPVLGEGIAAGAGYLQLQRRTVKVAIVGDPVGLMAGMPVESQHFQTQGIGGAEVQRPAFRPIHGARSEQKIRRGPLAAGVPGGVDHTPRGHLELVGALAFAQGHLALDAPQKCLNCAGQQNQQPGVRDHEAKLVLVPGKANQSGGQDVHAQHGQAERQTKGCRRRTTRRTRGRTRLQQGGPC